VTIQNSISHKPVSEHDLVYFCQKIISEFDSQKIESWIEFCFFFLL